MEDEQNIPILVSRARSELAEVETIEAALTLRNKAEGWALYLRKMKYAESAVNDAVALVALCEARVGRELKAAEERGEIYGQGGPRGNQYVSAKLQNGGVAKPTRADLGLSYRQSESFGHMARLSDNEIEEEAKVATNEGRVINMAHLRRKAIAKRAGKNGETSKPQPPSHLSAFARWLDTGGCFLADYRDGHDAAAQLREHGLRISPDLPLILKLLSEIASEIEAGQAA